MEWMSPFFLGSVLGMLWILKDLTSWLLRRLASFLMWRQWNEYERLGAYIFLRAPRRGFLPPALDSRSRAEAALSYNWWQRIGAKREISIAKETLARLNSPSPKAPSVFVRADDAVVIGFANPNSGWVGERRECWFEHWFPDPAGRFEERLWDGSAWTVHVRSRSAGLNSIDPLGPSPTWKRMA